MEALYNIDLDETALLEDCAITETEAHILQIIAKKCYMQSFLMGWHNKPREFGTRMALIHSEISEALEADRKGLMDSHLTHRKGAEVELADAVIRIFDTAVKENFDIAGALKEKLDYNRVRADHQLSNRSKVGGKQY